MPRIYTLAELAGMLARSALDVVAVHGGLDGSPLTLDSRRLMIIAEKDVRRSAGRTGVTVGLMCLNNGDWPNRRWADWLYNVAVGVH
jgi:hypothetical protein